MKAFITGIRGQDGSWLAEDLISDGVEVHGLVRRHSTPRHVNLEPFRDEVSLHEGDVTDPECIANLIKEIQPDQVFNLAAQSHVGTSFDQPRATFEATGYGAVHVFEAVRKHAPDARVFQASSSEMYGARSEAIREENRALTEHDRFEPISPYACAKTFAHDMARYYRMAYDLHICCGIMHNHESERRGPRFVTRKITLALARMMYGVQDRLDLGNLSAVRDWGYAPDYMRGARLLIEHDEPRDIAFATGYGRSVREFLEQALRCTGRYSELEPNVYFDQDAHLRPTDIPWLVGDPSQAKVILGWERKVGFSALVNRMLNHDLALIGEGTVEAEEGQAVARSQS